jgi:hypothetical protein
MTAPKFWTPDILFNVNNIIVLGWIALIFAPFHKLTKYFVLSPAIFLSIIYSIILFQTLFLRGPNSPRLDFFHLSGWFALLKDPFMIVGTTNHFCVMDLWAGQWMVNDFYSGYTFAYSLITDSNGTYQMKKSWTFGRIIFTIILLMTYMVAPFGFLVYHLAKFTFLNTYKSHTPIDFVNDESFNSISAINQLQNEILNRRPVRFGDQLPEPLRKIYHVILGIIGLIVLFTIALPAFIGLKIYCRIVYRPLPNQSTPNNVQNVTLENKLPSLTTPFDKKNWIQYFKSLLLKLSKHIAPEYVRNVTAEMRLKSLITPPNKRNWIWYLKFLLLQFSTFIEYILHANNPIVLFNQLDDYFTRKYHVDYFAFGDGIGVNSYELVKRYLQDLPPYKGYESLGWQVSTSQATFADLTTVFLSSNESNMKLSRDIIFQWLHSFPYNLNKNNNEARFYLLRIVPRKIDKEPDEDTIYQAIGEVMFFLATGGELRKYEREAYIDCVKNSMIFFPNWFNFLLAGHYLERKTLNSYYTLLQAFARYSDGQALRAAFKAAHGHISPSEVLKLIAVAFSIAGSAAPAKLAVSVIKRLWSEEDREKNVRLFKKNPHNFIKECARLDKVVPMVNVFATKEIANEIEDNFQINGDHIQIIENTPIHCSLVNANTDKKIFQNPEEFLPDRLDLNKIFVWNGVEEDILNKDKNKRPIRYCPGHDLSLDTIQYVTEQFLPFIPDDQVDYQQKIIDAEIGKILCLL